MHCELPAWILKQLELQIEDSVLVELIGGLPPSGSWAKFQPMSTKFTQISDPRAVLEISLRSYICLTNGDTITIYYNGEIFELKITGTKPSNTIMIHDCDILTEFDPPSDSKDAAEDRVIFKLPDECNLDLIEQEIDRSSKERGRVTNGFRLDGKRVAMSHDQETAFEIRREVRNQIIRGIPDHDWLLGTLQFKRRLEHIRPPKKAKTEPERKMLAEDSSFKITEIRTIAPSTKMINEPSAPSATVINETFDAMDVNQSGPRDEMEGIEEAVVRRQGLRPRRTRPNYAFDPLREFEQSNQRG